MYSLFGPGSYGTIVGTCRSFCGEQGKGTSQRLFPDVQPGRAQNARQNHRAAVAKDPTNGKSILLFQSQPQLLMSPVRFLNMPNRSLIRPDGPDENDKMRNRTRHIAALPDTSLLSGKAGQQMERQELNPLVLIMIEENKMKDNKTRPVDSYAHADFMESVFSNLRAFCDAECQRLTAGYPPTVKPEQQSTDGQLSAA